MKNFPKIVAFLLLSVTFSYTAIASNLPSHLYFSSVNSPKEYRDTIKITRARISRTLAGFSTIKEYLDTIDRLTSSKTKKKFDVAWTKLHERVDNESATVKELDLFYVLGGYHHGYSEIAMRFIRKCSLANDNYFSSLAQPVLDLQAVNTLRKSYYVFINEAMQNNYTQVNDIDHLITFLKNNAGREYENRQTIRELLKKASDAAMLSIGALALEEKKLRAL